MGYRLSLVALFESVGKELKNRFPHGSLETTSEPMLVEGGRKTMIGVGIKKEKLKFSISDPCDIST